MSHFVDRGGTGSSRRPGAEDLLRDVPRLGDSVTGVEILDAEKITVADAIEISNQALAATNNQIKRAQEMIARADIFLSKDEAVHQTKTARLEEMPTKSIQI